MSAPGWAFRTRYAAIFVTAVVGTLLTIGAFWFVCSWQYRVALIDFQGRARSYIEFMNADLGDSSAVMYDIAAFIGSMDRPVTSDEFARFTAASRERVSALRDTAWAPRVTLAQRSDFERSVRLTGVRAFAIKELDRRKAVIPAKPRPLYYALRYDEPARPSARSLLGLDLIFDDLRAAVVARAVRTGRPAATPPMDVVTVGTRGGGMLAYMPVYSSRRGSFDRRSVRGVVLGVFDVPQFVRSIVARHNTVRGLNLYLFNPGARADRRTIYRTPHADSGGSPPSERELLTGAHWQSNVMVFDQPLGAIVTPTEPLSVIRWTFLGIATLGVGLMVTAMTVAYLFTLLRRTLQLQALTTDLKAKTDEVTRISLHDALTGLPNRLMFAERINEEIAQFDERSPFALLYLDLDHFKPVNDRFGHGLGDRLLCVVAERIRECTRTADTIARLGGDEFAIILADADAALIAAVADRLIQRLCEAYTLDDQPVFIGVSIGVAIADHEATAEGLLAQADSAMYEAKAVGRGTFHVSGSDRRPMHDRGPFSFETPSRPHEAPTALFLGPSA